MLLCPVCGNELVESERGACCAAGHRFDRAREGYLYLLRSSKQGDAMGDPKAQARSRRDFLNRGYYAPLKDELVRIVGERAEASASPLKLLDICCGEGYYTSAMGRVPGVEAYGFDLGKEMVRLAAKRGGADYFVANLKAIPVADGAFDVVTHLFAPFNEREFSRVLAPNGSLFTVVPGARHLFGLKEALYDTPYLNDEKLPATEELELVGSRKIGAHITLETPGDIEAVFQMTPYYYRTRREDRERLAGLQQLETDIAFVIAEYRHRRGTGCR